MLGIFINNTRRMAGGKTRKNYSKKNEEKILLVKNVKKKTPKKGS